MRPTRVQWARLDAALADVLTSAATGTPDDLALLVNTLAGAIDRLPDVAAGLRRPARRWRGSRLVAYGWDEIGAALGITRQGAQQRFGRGEG